MFSDGLQRWWRNARAYVSAWPTRPRVGQWIYVQGRLYVGHGLDDFAGGRARIIRVVFTFGSYSVEIEQDPGALYGWPVLLEGQARLREEYGDQVAHPDPDSRPEFNRD